MDEPGTYGVVTAVTSNLLPEFGWWYESLARQGRYRITVVDLGLSPEEASLVKSKPVNVITPDVSFFSIDRSWPKWYKPAFIGMAPYEFRLWLDVDLIVAKPLEPIFSAMQHKPFLTNDHFAPKACPNRPGLYERFPAPGEDAPLNSGVVGLRLPRDYKLLQRWLLNVYTCHVDPEVRRLVTLHDQGCLLWAARALSLMATVESDRRWNWPAKRNLYDRQPQGKWPTPEGPRLGGDIIDNVVLDNPGATIIHFAGEPKLPVLCSLNHPRARVGQFAHRFADTTRVFGVGLERAGTHTLAETLRRACRGSSWIRHEFEPFLAEEALAAYQGEEFRTSAYEERMELYARTDCAFLADVNHRLAWFIDDLHARFPAAKFVLLLREPMDLIRSRLLSHVCWPSHLELCPGHYQQAVLNNRRDESPQNVFRITPTTAFDLVDWHVWEVVETIKHIAAAFSRLPPELRLTCWTHGLAESIPRLIAFTGKQLLHRDTAVQVAKQRFGAHPACDAAVLDWVDKILAARRVQIQRELGRAFRRLGVSLRAPIV